MIRHTFAGLLAAVLMPTALAAQTTLTIEATSADVYESPTAAARIIGLAPRGRVLEVAREDGDWVTVVWPEAIAGVGYVRLRIGSFAGTDRKEQFSVSQVRADVDAVEQAIWAIWAARRHSTTTLDEHPSQ
jgi:predicted methyltransferase